MDIYFDRLATELLALQDKKELREFLRGILTPKELAEIPIRLEIVRLLKKGVPQHAIAKKLGVGVATVTRGSKELSRGRFQHMKTATWRALPQGG